MADGNVDTTNLLRGIARSPVVFLVDDGVDRDGGLTRLTVTNDELALSATDRNHGINCFDTGLHGFVNGLAGHNARSLKFECTASVGLNVAQSVDGVSERVDHATEIAFADGNREHFASARDFLAFDNAGELTENHNTDFVFVEVQRETQRSVRKSHELVGHDTGESFDVGDAVGGVDDVTHLFDGRLARLVRLDEVFQRVTNLVSADCQVCHGLFLFSRRACPAEVFE